jgi:uncharacterized protein (DUF58 family)
VPHDALTFPLTARRRVVGVAFGAMHSARRGIGKDVAGSRPYQPGDDVDAIDWAASAKLSAAHGSDEFIVREHYADEAPRVVIVVDRRPEMALFPPGMPWLSKPEALATTTALIVDSAVAARGYVGYVDHGDGDPDDPFWHPPRSQRELPPLDERVAFRAPADAVERGLDHLLRVHPPLPAGSFVFVLSDFLSPPPESSWLALRERRWDAVPVVIQDPVWEQSFPDVGGVVVPFGDPASGDVRYARFSAREARERRERNEARLAALLVGFRNQDVEPVLVSSADSQETLWQFVEWSEQRLFWRGQGW